MSVESIVHAFCCIVPCIYPLCWTTWAFFWFVFYYLSVATTIFFYYEPREKKRISRSAPEPFGESVHCLPKLLEFNSLRTALPFIGPKRGLFRSSFLSPTMCWALPPAQLLFPGLPLNSKIMPYIKINTSLSLLLFTECSLSSMVSAETWFTYSLYKWSTLIFKHLKRFTVRKWKCYPPCSLKIITLLSSSKIRVSLMVSLPGSNISPLFLYR